MSSSSRRILKRTKAQAQTEPAPSRFVCKCTGVLLTGVHVLNTVSLVLDRARMVEELPPAVLALILIGGRADLGITGVSDSVAVSIGLIGVSRERAIVDGVKNEVIVIIRIDAIS